MDWEDLRKGRALPWLCGLGALLPPLAVAIAVSRYHVQVPVWDQWDLVPLLESTYQRIPTLGELAAMHNEHRPLFPRIAFLLLARLSSWDVRLELAANLATAGMIYALLLWGISRSERAAGRRTTPIAWTLLSVAVFSLAQWENWLWGWQLQVFMCVAAVLGGLLALGFGGVALPAPALAAACGTLATWSFAGGLFFWPVALVSIALAEDAPRRRVRSAALLASIGAANLLLYLRNFQRPAHHPAPLEALRHPVDLVEYTLNFIGSPLAYKSALAAGLGGAGLLLLLHRIWILIRAGSLRSPSARAWLSVAAYVVISAVVSAAARSGLGTDHALASRYATLSIPFWVSVCALLSLVGGTTGLRSRSVAPRLERSRPRALVIGAVALLAAAHSLNSLPAFRVWHDRVEFGRQILVKGGPITVLLGLHTVSSLRRGVPIARARRWSCFKDAPQERIAPGGGS